MQNFCPKIENGARILHGDEILRPGVDSDQNFKNNFKNQFFIKKNWFSMKNKPRKTAFDPPKNCVFLFNNNISNHNECKLKANKGIKTQNMITKKNSPYFHIILERSK